ncbi:hypothetical protein ACFW04_002138 [Cataglyphis niger]
MNIRENIKKATSLDYVDNNATFFRLPGLSQATKDRMMNDRKMKKPKNIHLLEDDSDNDNDVVDNFMNNKVKPTFDKHAVSAAIKEVNGGRDLSNKNWEKLHAKYLENIINSEKEISQKTSDHNLTTCSENQSEDLSNIYIKQKHKLSRNAAIMSLLRKKQISLEDIIIPNKTSTKKENELALHEMIDGYIMDNDKYNHVESVPLYEDPDISVHPLQMGIDEKKFKDIDFTVSRIGKKKTKTPREHFLEETNDDYFNFVKKKNNTS